LFEGFGSNEEEVEKTTTECIKNASPGEVYIISSRNIIHDSVPARNFVTMVKITRKFGKYLIKI